jgi:PAS domain S-box-containing protein
MDGDARFLYVNSRIKTIAHLDPEEFYGKTCREVGMPDFYASLWEKIAFETATLGKSVEREMQIEISGYVHTLHIRTVSEKIATEKPTFIATMRDITSARRTERHIQDLAQRLTYHMNNTPLAIMEWDTKGNCLTWNGEAEDMFGWTRRELKIKPIDWMRIVHPDDRPGVRVLLQRLSKGRTMSDFVKCRTVSRDGSMLFCECHLSALLDSDGQAKSILWVANNVTARELAEQEMQQLYSSLEKKIHERTAELEASNSELQREILARKALEGELITISERAHRRVGHDLHDGVCQELSGIRFSLEAISKKRRKGTVQREQMDKLSQALERAVHHIRLLSRGLAPLELEDGNLAAALEELAANTTALFHIECAVKCRGRSQKLEIEKAINLFRIAQEAIQNAIKHGKADRIQIDLDLHHGSLSIADNGNGIKDEPTAPVHGTGMGLKIMRHRAGAIQGSVAVECLSAGGVRVVCKFPK